MSAHESVTTSMKSADQSHERDAAVPVFDWDTDKINPLNWPLWKRTYHAVLPAVFGFVV